MKHRFNCGLIIRIIMLISGICFLFGCQGDTGQGPLAPDFNLKDLGGTEVTLGQYRGKVVLLDFWATWCPPCRAAIPELIDLQHKYKKEGLVIMGISMDDPRRVNDDKLSAFVEKIKINYLVLRFNNNLIENYFGNRAPSLPTIYVIDREGQVRDKIVGHNPEAIRKSLQRLLT